MSNIALAKPSTITGAIITCTKFGTGGTDVYIKVNQFVPIFTIPERESSGDGDAAPSFDSQYWLYCNGHFNGWMVAASVSTFLLINLIDSTKNPLAASLKFNFATQQILTIPKMLINAYIPVYERTLPYIPVRIGFKATDSHPTWGTT